MTFLVKLGFWIGDGLITKYYKNYVDKKRVENMTLWSLKIYGGIVLKLKAFKYKKDYLCYLSSFPLDLDL